MTAINARTFSPIVKYTVYLHSSKESVYAAALDAGFTPEELSGSFADLTYIGYEVPVEVTVNRETGKITEKYPEPM